MKITELQTSWPGHLKVDPDEEAEWGVSLSGSLLSYTPKIVVDLWSEMKAKKKKLSGKNAPTLSAEIFFFISCQSKSAGAQLIYTWKFHPLLRLNSSRVADFVLVTSSTSRLVEFLVSPVVSFSVYYLAQAKVSHLWPADVSFRRKSEVMLSSGLFSLLTERLMLHSSQCTMTTYNVLFEVSDLHRNTLQYRTGRKCTSKHSVCDFMLFLFMLH